MQLPEPGSDCCFNLPLILRSQSKQLGVFKHDPLTPGTRGGNKPPAEEQRRSEEETLLDIPPSHLLCIRHKDTAKRVSGSMTSPVTVLGCSEAPLPSFLNSVVLLLLSSPYSLCLLFLKRCILSPWLTGAATMRCFRPCNSIIHQLFRGPEIKQFASSFS